MNKHIEKAMELRNETPMVNNCAQTIMRVYADELGIDENLCAAIGCLKPRCTWRYRKCLRGRWRLWY